ncbi:hypothetical protein GDO81_019970 [Engystomops pustulosus]|uniref:Uncharacterized protein n=1 Tax=Engystomops pustulosus TaxID=76066 RepID=A0AAV6ZRR3_ENGPU|nr:hypothetical protein GDO81_019970 [Engystomops pustulosus]
MCISHSVDFSCCRTSGMLGNAVEGVCSICDGFMYMCAHCMQRKASSAHRRWVCVGLVAGHRRPICSADAELQHSPFRSHL